MPKRRSHQHKRRRKRGRAPFALPTPSVIPIAGAPRYTYPEGWAVLEGSHHPYRTGKIILTVIALPALILALTTLLGLIFGGR